MPPSTLLSLIYARTGCERGTTRDKPPTSRPRLYLHANKGSRRKGLPPRLSPPFAGKAKRGTPPLSLTHEQKRADIRPSGQDPPPFRPRLRLRAIGAEESGPARRDPPTFPSFTPQLGVELRDRAAQPCPSPCAHTWFTRETEGRAGRGLPSLFAHGPFACKVGAGKSFPPRQDLLAHLLAIPTIIVYAYTLGLTPHSRCRTS
ncbi:hypothetical protein V8E53_012496 [Lactarius tabidus]